MNSFDNNRWIAGELDAWMNGVLFLMPNWKWLGLVVALFAGLILKSLLTQLFHALKNASWAKGRATGFLLYFLETDLQKPLAWILTCVFWSVSLDSLSLPLILDKYLGILIQLILSINAIVLVYRAAEAVGRLFFKITVSTGAPLDSQIAPMATKILKVVVIIFGVLITIQNFGINVMSILAGLGLGGLALALAAQDTAANLFGSIMIIADKPFRVGDLVKLGSIEGVVEEIGFRSTRIRTATKSLITMPNSTVAKENIENLEFRTQRRIRHVFGLTYDAKADQINAFKRELEIYLSAHPKVDQTSTLLRLNALADFSLNVLAQYYLFTTDPNEEFALQEEFLFHAMKSAEKVGVQFAFPTQTHHLNLDRVPKELQSIRPSV